MIKTINKQAECMMNPTLLIQQLSDENAHTRSQAVLALGKNRATEAVSDILHVLFHDPELNVQEDATWALTRMPEEATPTLIEALQHTESSVRHNAAHTLGKIGSGRAVEALTTCLQDTDMRVRLKAAYALGQIGDSRAIEPLVALLSDTSHEVQLMAAEVLGRFGSAAAPALAKGLQHPDCAVREFVVGILGEIGDYPLLAQALEDECWQVRFAAVEGLGQDASYLDTLRPLLEDPHERVRSLVRTLLKRLSQ
jgi:HEAT repeat protein